MIQSGTDPTLSRAWDEPIKAAILQTELFLGDMDANLASADRLISAISSHSPDIIVLPEVFSTGFSYDALPDIVHRSDEVIGLLSDRAKEIGSHMIFTAVVEENGRYYNRLFYLDDKGIIKGTYDKTHLFTRANEHDFFTPGDTLTTLKMNDVTMGPLICYEVRFPELSRELVLQGAGILIYPAQWPEFRIFQWDALLKARAIENQCFVIGANIYGDHGGSMMGGMSAIYSPFGDLLGRVEKGEGWSISELDPEKMYSLREKIPVLQERRTDLKLK